MASRIIYHGSPQQVSVPEIRPTRYGKDFSTGFYCTLMKEQAIRWATRYPVIGYVNIFLYDEDQELRIKRFDRMTEEWLDLIASCRNGGTHDFDIVEGPMADDSIFNYVQDFADGKITREAFWALARFKKPTHQLCFHTPAALRTLTFQGAEIHENR